MVNGKEVELSPQELKEVEAREERWKIKKARRDSIAYKHKRKREYPEIGDQLDAILKQLNYLKLEGKMDLIQELDGIVADWLTVKRKHPKPEDK